MSCRQINLQTDYLVTFSSTLSAVSTLYVSRNQIKRMLRVMILQFEI